MPIDGNGEYDAPVIDLMEEQKGVTEKGGTMRLGGYPCTLTKGSKAAKAYGKTQIIERHRHRYEFNNDYLDEFTKAGLKPVGINPRTRTWSKWSNWKTTRGSSAYNTIPSTRVPLQNPHPLFVSFVKAATDYCQTHNSK